MILGKKSLNSHPVDTLSTACVAKEMNMKQSGTTTQKKMFSNATIFICQMGIPNRRDRFKLPRVKIKSKKWQNNILNPHGIAYTTGLGIAYTIGLGQVEAPGRFDKRNTIKPMRNDIQHWTRPGGIPR